MDIWPVIEAALGGEKADLGGDTRLDPAYLEAKYPEQHATFQAWVASMSQ